MTKRLTLAFMLSALVLVHPASTQQRNTQQSSASRPAQTAKNIPVPSGLIVKTSAHRGVDPGARINAADKALGAKAGWIVVDTRGEISTQVRLSPGHKLKFSRGRFPLRNPVNNFSGTIILGDKNC